MSDKAKITVEDAEQVLRADYWSDVRGIADEARELAKKGEIADEDALNEWVEQSIDGCGRVIYTGQAMLGLKYGDNDGVAIEEGLVDPSSFTEGIPWSVLMYHAMLADVRSMLDDVEYKSDEEDAEA